MGQRNRVTVGMICIAALAGVGAPWSAAWGQIKPPAENSPLKRTKTKLKPPSAPTGPRALDGVRPTGRRETPRQPRITMPIESVHRGMNGENWLRERVRGNSGGELNIALQEGTARVSEVFTTDGMPTQGRAMRNVIDAARDGRRPANNEELREIVRGNSMSLSDARARYLGEGYNEVRMSSNEVVFVKTDDPASLPDVSDMLDGRVSERMYRSWVDDWERDFPDREWIYEGSTRRSCANGACSTGRPLDTFILRGTMMPERELTEVEAAELEMDDAERAAYALERGDFELAVDRYESYIKHNPEEAAARRSLGVAYLNLDRVLEAITMIADAYELEPSLATEPIEKTLFDDGEAGIYRLLQRVVPIAHRSPSSDAGLVAAVLMQSQGRKKEAARMLLRAGAKGLPESIRREFVFAGIDAGAAPSARGPAGADREK